VNVGFNLQHVMRLKLPHGYAGILVTPSTVHSSLPDRTLSYPIPWGTDFSPLVNLNRLLAATTALVLMSSGSTWAQTATSTDTPHMDWTTNWSSNPVPDIKGPSSSTRSIFGAYKTAP
jgi:hypothetical protein